MNLSGMPVGWGPRMSASMFRSAPFAPTLGRKDPAPKSLDQTAEQQWFARAKAAVGQYDELWAKTQQIANKTYREELAAKYHTTPEDRDGALYRRNSVAYNIAQAESYTPVNYLVFQSQQQNRVTKLEDWNQDFKEDVEYGSQQYGLLPEAQVIEKLTTVTQTEAPAWLLPAGLGLGALVLGMILFKD